MVEISFTNPSYLWVLVLVPFLIVLHFLTLKQSRAAAIQFSNFEALERVARGEVLGTPYRGLLKNKNLGLLIFRAFVYCLLIFSVAGTVISYKGKSSVYEYIIAIDTSSSMLADDFKPTRLEAAKQSAMRFIDFVPSGSQIGVVTFASTAIVELRPTSNLEDVKDSISNIVLQKSGGTAIGDAIITAANLFNSDKSKIIILLTDGQSNVGIDQYTATQYAKQNNIAIYTIGVATNEGGNVTILNLLSKLDDVLLRKISQETNGRFFMAEHLENMTEAFKQIGTSSERLISTNISWFLLVIGIVLLGFEWILINTVYRAIP